MSMLSFSDLLRRKDSSADEDARFEQDATFEHDIEAALVLDADSTVLDEDDAELETIELADDADEAVAFEDGAEQPSLPFPSEVLTPHAQAIMAAFSVFEEANDATRDELARIGKAFTAIVSNHTIGRQFVDGCRQEIVRASELEQANQRLESENRRLLERCEKQEHARERLEDLLESSRRRETRLLQECDTLRMNVSDLRLEVIDLRNANATAEHARGEMHMAIAARTAEAERLAREIEVMRERMASVTADLDASQRRHSEVRLKLDDLQALHTAEIAKYAELNGRVTAGDKEIVRLQKQCDVAEAELREASLALQTAEHEIWERDRRHQSELKALKTEIGQLSGRLQIYSAGDDHADGALEDDDPENVPVIPLRTRGKGRQRGTEAAADAAE